MPSNNRFRATASAAKYASKYASKAAAGLGRWGTTDHTGSAKFFASMPRMGFVDTITIVLVHIVTTILGAIGSAFVVYLLIAYGIPALLFL
jgi:hypothetical protein